MKRAGKSKADIEFQKALGKRLQEAILAKGYSSVHEFWIHKAGDTISRSSLNYIAKGETDVKMTTLHALAKLLKLKTRDLLDFE